VLTVLFISSKGRYAEVYERGFESLIISPMEGTMRADVAEAINFRGIGAIAYQREELPNLSNVHLTYTSPQDAKITVAHAPYLQTSHIQVVGTNHTFRDVAGLFREVLSPSFFFYTWLENGDDAILSNVAILNMQAAYNLFGNTVRGHIGPTRHVYINGESFRVLDTIDDGNRLQAYIYVPLTSITTCWNVDSIVILRGGISYFYKDQGLFDVLDAIGVTAEEYHFTNLYVLQRRIRDFSDISAFIWGLIIIEVIISNAIKIALRNGKEIKRQDEKEDIVKGFAYFKPRLKLLISCVIAVFMIVFTFLVAPFSIAETYEIATAPMPLTYVHENFFSYMVWELIDINRRTVTLFWATLVVYVLYYVIGIWQATGIAFRMSEQETNIL